MTCPNCNIEFLAAANKKTPYCTACQKKLKEAERCKDPAFKERYYNWYKARYERKKLEKEKENA